MTSDPGVALPGNRWDLLDGVTPDEPPLVSVIVAHYRQPEQLARTLEALRRQDHPADRLEVIVADDGSPEHPRVPRDVRLERQEDDGFRAAAVRNLGAAAAHGQVLVFLDADSTPEPAFIGELVRLPALASDCVTVGRRRHANLAGTSPSEGIERAAVGRELDDPAWLSEAYRDSRNLLDADDRSYRHVISAVLACSRSFFAEVGGFDESFSSYGGEDWEWAYRAWIRGAVLAHVPTAVAWHDGPDAAGRPEDLAIKNAEAMRLADLIPVPGSRGRGRRSAKVDVAVVGPEGATPEQFFVSVDSVLSALPGAEELGEGDRMGVGRFDRVRVCVQILHPLRISGDGLAALIARAQSGAWGELLLVDESGTEMMRVGSMRARARQARWGRDDLFPTERVVADGAQVLGEDVDVEGYVGGWS